jgi:hypothetical protein
MEGKNERNREKEELNEGRKDKRINKINNKVIRETCSAKEKRNKETECDNI